MWWVTVVRKQPQELLQAFARDRNEKQKKEYVVDFTIYDVLRNMKNVANTWEVRSGEQLINPQSGAVRHGVITEIAIEYCDGGGSATNTARQMAGVAIKLTEEVINEIGRIVTSRIPN